MDCYKGKWFLFFIFINSWLFKTPRILRRFGVNFNRAQIFNLLTTRRFSQVFEDELLWKFKDDVKSIPCKKLPTGIRHGNSRVAVRGNDGNRRGELREDTNRAARQQLDMQASQLTFYFLVFQVLHAAVSQIQVWWNQTKKSHFYEGAFLSAHRITHWSTDLPITLITMD